MSSALPMMPCSGVLSSWGDVCRKLAAAALGVLLIRHVEGEEHRADRLTAGLDAAEIELIGAPAALAAHLAVAVFHGVGDGAAHVAAAVDGQEVLPPHSRGSRRRASAPPG